jgi:hypothetical protein
MTKAPEPVKVTFSQGGCSGTNPVPGGVAAPLEPTAEQFCAKYFSDHLIDIADVLFVDTVACAKAYAAAVSKKLREELAQAVRGRKHTQDWYARHYGKLQEWARKQLPEPWQTEFFSCIANGTSSSRDSDHLAMPSAYSQLLADQYERAEAAEARITALEKEVDSLKMLAHPMLKLNSTELRERTK